MYSKFSIVQFTTLSYIQNQSNDSTLSTAPNRSCGNKPLISIGENNVEIMPKKRGRPIKNESKSKTRMVITSTENITNHAGIPGGYYSEKKLQKRDNACWERRVKSKSTSNSIETINTPVMQNNNTPSSVPHMTTTCIHDHVENIQHETTQTVKKRIIRSSISIKELLN